MPAYIVNDFRVVVRKTRCRIWLLFAAGGCSVAAAVYLAANMGRGEQVNGEVFGG